MTVSLDIPSHFVGKIAVTPSGVLQVSKGYEHDPYLHVLHRRAERLGIKLHQVEMNVTQQSSTSHLESMEQNRPQETLQMLLKNILQARGSDLHIHVTKDVCHVRGRFHGNMQTMATFTAEYGTRLCASCFQLCETTDATFSPHQVQTGRLDGRLVTSSMASARVQFTPTHNDGLLMVIRVQRTCSDHITTFKNIWGDERWTQISGYLRHGLTLITGPTGSGKTSLAYGLMQQTAQDNSTVMTVEDPPEISLDFAQQMLLPHTDDPTKREKHQIQALAAALRCDPDYLLVGEIRHASTARLAWDAARTGHPVVATMHASNASAAYARLRQFGINQDELPQVISLMIDIRLLGELCSSCAKPTSEYEMDQAKKWFGGKVDLSDLKQKGTGCDNCRAGYVNRIPFVRLSNQNIKERWVDILAKPLLKGSIAIPSWLNMEL